MIEVQVRNPNHDKIPISVRKFAGGEIQVQVHEVECAQYMNIDEVHVKSTIHNADHVMELMMTVDALYRTGVEKIRLTLPYLPYARQDRVCSKGEAFSLHVFAGLLNSMEFSSVAFHDVHSPVALGLVNRSINVKMVDLIKPEHTTTMLNTVILAPDRGAKIRAREIADKFGVKSVHLEKTRDSQGFVTYEDFDVHQLHNKQILVVDDICDGGRTFVSLAEKLKRNCKKQRVDIKRLDLLVTHGIFSNGYEELNKHYNTIRSIHTWDY